MTPDEFRAAGHATIEWIANYLEHIEEMSVCADVEPGEIRSRLPVSPPEDPEPWTSILEDVGGLLDGITHWQHPSFFGYFPANASPPAILGELLSAGLGVQGMSWITSPACTELETHVLDWLIEAMALPQKFHSSGAGGGVIQDTASSASLCALLAARDRHPASDRSRLRLYTSQDAHSSIAKGARIAGFSEAQLHLVEVDDARAMRPTALHAAIQADVANGLIPSFVCATVGTTSTTAIDPVPAIAEICEPTGAWLHVDAAYAGSAAICPEFQFLNAGLERADSYVFNPHKWLLTNFDCSAFWVADRGALLRSLSILPEYLRNQATMSGAVIDYRDWHIPLGRRFRALKLWFVMRSYGLSGLRDHIRRHVDLARTLAARIEAHPDFEVVGPVPLSLVCFRHRASDQANQTLLDALNASGDAYLTHTRVNDQLVLRFAIGGRLTESRHVEAAWAHIQDLAQRLL